LSKDYAAFKRGLSEASEWENKIRICLDGIFNNVFFRGAKIISDLNIETLKVRFPELYETVRDNNVRKALVISEMFVATLESTILRKMGVEELEVEMDPRMSPHGWAFMTSIGQDDFTQLDDLYRGEDAVKVFFKSVFIIAKDLNELLDSPILTDVWRVKSGLESKRNKLREIMYSKLREIVEKLPEEAKRFTKPEKVVDEMVYFLWHWYNRTGKKAKKKIERLLQIK